MGQIMTSKQLGLQENKWKWSPQSRMKILIFGDIFLLLGSLVLSLFLWTVYEQTSFSFNLILESETLLLFFVLWLSISVISDSYNSKNFSQLFLSIKEPARTSVLCLLVYLAVYFLAPRNYLPRTTAVFYALLSCGILILWRIIHYKIFSSDKILQKVLIVGNYKSPNIVSLLQKNATFYTYVDTLPIADIASLREKIIEHQIDEVIYFPKKTRQKALNVLSQLEDSSVHITSADIFYEEICRKTSIDSLGLLDLPNTHGRSGVIYKLGKKLIDLSCAIIGLSFFILLFPLLAILIKLDSKGPIFFSQIRIGKRGRPFRLWKLRTMTVNTEKESMWTQDADQRITRIGKFLRKSRLDELPQLWNVIKGELSIVGIRPLSKEQCDEFAKEIPFHNMRHIAKPGITGWAVINQGHVNTLEGARVRLEYDLYYVKYRNIWLDIFIILRTIWTVATLKGM